MSSPRILQCHVCVLFLVFFAFTRSHAVVLSKLIGLRSAFPFIQTLHPLKSDTVIISAFLGSSFSELRLDPIVNIPRGSLNESTLLLVHLHPRNQTVIWANAITTIISTNRGVAVDSKSNSYVVGETRREHDRIVTPFKATIDIIKYNRAGKRVWETSYTPPLSRRGDPLYRINSFGGFPTKSSLQAIVSSLLVISAKRILPRKEVPAFFVFAAKTGKFLRIIDTPLPEKNNDFQLSAAAVTSTNEGPIACFGFYGTTGFFGNKPKRLQTSCASVESPGRVRSNILEEVDPDTASFFSLTSMAFDQSRRVRKDPSLFFATEKVTSPGLITDIPELFIRRLSSKTLKEVNWRTGRGTGSTDPIIISLPTPDLSVEGIDSTVRLISRDYGENLKTFVILLSTEMNFTGFKQETKRTGRIIVSGVPSEQSLSTDHFAPAEYWLFFVDRKRRLHPILVNRDIGAKFLLRPTEVAFSHDARFVYVFGAERSRLVVQTIKTPVLS